MSNVSVWPPGEEWPADMLPPLVLTLEVSALELQSLIEHHEDFGEAARKQHSHETELFHAARCSYLRQRLAVVAPHMLRPDQQGEA